MEKAGRYRILQKLGQGGMGVVFLAEDPMLGRQAAIKTVRMDDLIGPDRQASLRDKFLNEARTVAQLKHPSIITLHDIFEENGLLFIVMEYVDGEPLSALLARTEGPLPPDRALRILRDTAGALDYAHGHQIVHRDVKPENLLLDSTGMVKIADFGIARLTNSATRTITNAVVGTPEFMAPEQIEGRAVDGRADQFALAGLAYRMLTGHRPYDAETLPTLYKKICCDMPPAPSSVNGQLGTAADAVFSRALAKAPAERYSTCLEFVDALEKALVGQVHDLPGAGRGPAPLSKRTLAVAAVAALLVILAVIGYIYRPVPVHSTATVPPPVAVTPPSAPETAAAPPPAPEPPPVPIEQPKAAVEKRKVEPAARAAVRAAPTASSGTVVWSGELAINDDVTITGNSASVGSVSGALPGVPVQLEVHPATVSVTVSPSAENGYRQMSLHNGGRKQSLVIIKWSAERN